MNPLIRVLLLRYFEQQEALAAQSRIKRDLARLVDQYIAENGRLREEVQRLRSARELALV